MKKRFVMIAVIIFIIGAYNLYQNYDGRPGELPSAEHVIQAINQEFDKANADEVLDLIQLDSKHAFIPFVSAGGQYGISYWVWENFKWTIGRVDTGGGPYIWKLDRKDPSKQFVVWNFNPQGIISGMDYYLIRERDAGSSGGNEFYTPRIQMKWSPMHVEAKSYGALPFPEEWASLMKEDMRVNHTGGSDLFLFGRNSRSMMHVGWLPLYNKESNTVADTVSSTHGYSSKHLDLEFIGILNTADLELPE